jgi:hypothetical protein
MIREGSVGVLCSRLWKWYVDRENTAEALTLIFSSYCQEPPIPFYICGKETWLSFIFYLEWTALFTRKFRIWIFATHCIETLHKIISESKVNEASKKFNILCNEKRRDVCWMKKVPSSGTTLKRSYLLCLILSLYSGKSLDLREMTWAFEDIA